MEDFPELEKLLRKLSSTSEKTKLLSRDDVAEMRSQFAEAFGLRLDQVLTRLDESRSHRKDYNRYALAQYIEAGRSATEDYRSGKSMQVAIETYFEGWYIKHIMEALCDEKL